MLGGHGAQHVVPPYEERTASASFVRPSRKAVPTNLLPDSHAVRRRQVQLLSGVTPKTRHTTRQYSSPCPRDIAPAHVDPSATCWRSAASRAFDPQFCPNAMKELLIAVEPILRWGRLPAERRVIAIVRGGNSRHVRDVFRQASAFRSRKDPETVCTCRIAPPVSRWPLQNASGPRPSTNCARGPWNQRRFLRCRTCG